MHTEEEFTRLEEEEREYTLEAILILLAILKGTKTNLEKELRNFYQQYGRDGVVTWTEARKWVGLSDRRRRLVVLLAYISDEFDNALNQLTPEFRKFLVKIVNRESQFFGTEVDEEKVISKPWGTDESTWDSRLEADVALWVIYLANDIKQLILRQQTIDEVLTQIGRRFTTIESIIRRLAMTESTAVGSLTRLEIFKELGITKYTFYTRPDERRCETCGAMHGMVFPIAAYEVGVTASPIHPWCRCWEVPVTE